MSSNAEHHDRAYDAFLMRMPDEYPELVEALASASPPRRRLFCPRGHLIEVVTLSRDYNGRPFLAHVDGLALPPVAADARPGAGRSSVCAEPGCPNLTPCAAHPEVEEDVDYLFLARVTLRCRIKGCGYAGVHQQHTLLALYGATLRFPELKMQLRA